MKHYLQPSNNTPPNNKGRKGLFTITIAVHNPSTFDISSEVCLMFFFYGTMSMKKNNSDILLVEETRESLSTEQKGWGFLRGVKWGSPQ